MSENRECALVALAKLNDLADGTKGRALPAEVGATMAVAYALLDVADAIREQTAALVGEDKGVILVERNQ